MKTWGWRFHKAFSLAGGLLYALMRRRDERVGAGLGLAFGAAFFVVVDEILMPVQGLTPGPLAFSWKVHARGAIAHIAYGVAAEATWRTIDRALYGAVPPLSASKVAPTSLEPTRTASPPHDLSKEVAPIH